MPAAPHLHVREFDRRSLRPRHLSVMPKLAEAYFACDGPLDAAVLDELTREVDGAMSTASKTLRFGLLLMLDVIDWSPLFILGKLAFFSDLPLEDRARFLVRLERSSLTPLALIFVAWKTLLTMIYFERPAELASLGYPGDERRRYLSVVSAP